MTLKVSLAYIGCGMQWLWQSTVKLVRVIAFEGKIYGWEAAWVYAGQSNFREATSIFVGLDNRLTVIHFQSFISLVWTCSGQQTHCVQSFTQEKHFPQKLLLDSEWLFMLPSIVCFLNETTMISAAIFLELGIKTIVKKFAVLIFKERDVHFVGNDITCSRTNTTTLKMITVCRLWTKKFEKHWSVLLGNVYYDAVKEWMDDREFQNAWPFVSLPWC